jgi:hypothetical protein
LLTGSARVDKKARLGRCRRDTAQVELSEYAGRLGQYRQHRVLAAISSAPKRHRPAPLQAIKFLTRGTLGKTLVHSHLVKSEASRDTDKRVNAVGRTRKSEIHAAVELHVLTRTYLKITDGSRSAISFG